MDDGNSTEGIDEGFVDGLNVGKGTIGDLVGRFVGSPGSSTKNLE